MVQQSTKIGVMSSSAAATDDDNISESVASTSFSRRNLTVLFVSLLLDLVAFTVILPLLPSLLDYYGSHDDEVVVVLVVVVVVVVVEVVVVVVVVDA